MPPEANPEQQLSVDQLWAQETGPDAASSAEAAHAAAPAEDPSGDLNAADAAPAQAAANSPASAPAAPNDPLQQMLTELRAENAQMRREMQEGLRTVQGRVGSIQSRLDRSAQPTNAEVARALKTPQGMQQLKRDFPEIAAPIEEFVRENLVGLNPTNPEQLVAAMQEKLAADSNVAVQKQLQQLEMRRVERAHPKWLETINTPDFVNWRAAQPADVQALGASDLADDAIAMINAYKKSRTTVADVQARRQAVNAAAVTSKGSAQARVGVKSEDDMTEAEYWDHVTKQATQ